MPRLLFARSRNTAGALPGAKPRCRLCFFGTERLFRYRTAPILRAFRHGAALQCLDLCSATNNIAQILRRFNNFGQNFSGNFLLPARARRSFSRQIKIFTQHKSRNENAFRLCSPRMIPTFFRKQDRQKPQPTGNGYFGTAAGRFVLYIFSKKSSRNFSGITKKRSTLQSDGGFLLGLLLIFSSRKKSSNRDASFGVNRIHLPS